jgi:hypothetical protein
VLSAVALGGATSCAIIALRQVPEPPFFHMCARLQKIKAPNSKEIAKGFKRRYGRYEFYGQQNY